MSRENKSAPVPPRDKQAEETPWLCQGVERGVWTEPMLALLARGEEGTKWFSLIDKVWHQRTLGLAWSKVLANAGSCGVDGITVGQFSKDSARRLLDLEEQLKEGRYQPKPAKRVWIPKLGSSELRPLGIPTVTDRVVQAALKMVIEPIFESRFHPHSYGFRPGRGCKDALQAVDNLLAGNSLHIVEVDIKGYFDAIDHGKLMKLLRERISDGRVLKLVEKFLKQGVLEGEDWAEGVAGTPQGGVISPLLANVYLDPLDWLMDGLGFDMVRYADDMVVLCQSRAEAEAALDRLRAWMAEAGLTLHPEKTRLEDLNEPGGHFDFLGYRFQRSGRGTLLKLVRPKSLQKIRESVRERTRRTCGESLGSVVESLNRSLGGWFVYFMDVHRSEMTMMDSWLRMRLRSILRKRHGGKCRGRGKDHQRWPNRYFHDLGLLNLEQAWESEHASLRKGAKH
jgi:RNA-directed DNA polymerase